MQDRTDLGDWYVVDLRTNAVAASHIDLEGWARDAGLLQDYEQMVKD
jgi:hypothetical protein